MTLKKKKKMPPIRVAFLLFCMVIPVLQVIIFYFYSNITAFPMAFRDADGAWTLQNFVRFWEELTSVGTELTLAFRNTLLTFAIGLITYPFKVLVSYFIYKKIPFSGFYRIVFFLPGLIFSVASSLIFTYIISPEGFIAQWVGQLAGVDYVPELLSDTKFANMTIFAQLLWLGFPGDLILWGGAFARIPEDVLESARIDGVRWYQEFIHVIVPLVWPMVGLQLVLMFCGLFDATGNVWLLTKGGYGTMTFSAWMYQSLLGGSGTNTHSNVYNYLSAVGLSVSAVALVISFTVRRLASKIEDVEY